MDRVEQQFLYERSQAVLSDIVPLNCYRDYDGRTINQFLVKIYFCQLCILRAAAVAQLKLSVQIGLTKVQSSPDFQVDRTDRLFCMTTRI